MFDDGILKDNTERKVSQNIYETITDEEKKNLNELKSIEIDVEQVEYIQTIAQGWAFPLNKFMDEL
jgi:ATP sulfurylase